MAQHEPNSPPHDGPGQAGAASVTANWLQASKHLATSLIEANRAALATFGLSTRTTEAGEDTVSYERPGWHTERDIQAPGSITVGDTVRFSRHITQQDVTAFADASGDTNRLHLDEGFATASRFGDRIVHGTLVSGLISAALARLPGLTIYLSQDIQFLRPARTGERVTSVVEVVEDLGDDRYRLTTEVVDEAGDPYVVGEADVLIDEVPATREPETG